MCHRPRDIPYSEVNDAHACGGSSSPSRTIHSHRVSIQRDHRRFEMAKYYVQSGAVQLVLQVRSC